MPLKNILIAIFSLLSPVMADGGDTVLMTREILQPGYYYFVGNTTGWVGKTKASHGIRPQFKFYVDEGSEKNRYVLQITQTKLSNSRIYAGYKFEIHVIDNSRATGIPVWSAEFEDKLQKSEGGKALTNKPFIPFEQSDQPKVNTFESLVVNHYPYFKVNNFCRSVVVAKSRDKKEISNYISIPKTLVFYKWDFSRVLK